jgi:hypothetical protein
MMTFYGVSGVGSVNSGDGGNNGDNLMMSVVVTV